MDPVDPRQLAEVRALAAGTVDLGSIERLEYPGRRGSPITFLRIGAFPTRLPPKDAIGRSSRDA